MHNLYSIASIDKRSASFPLGEGGIKRGIECLEEAHSRISLMVNYGSNEPFYPWPTACPFSKGRQRLAVSAI